MASTLRSTLAALSIASLLLSAAARAETLSDAERNALIQRLMPQLDGDRHPADARAAAEAIAVGAGRKTYTKTGPDGLPHTFEVISTPAGVPIEIRDSTMIGGRVAAVRTDIYSTTDQAWTWGVDGSNGGGVETRVKGLVASTVESYDHDGVLRSRKLDSFAPDGSGKRMLTERSTDTWSPVPGKSDAHRSVVETHATSLGDKDVTGVAWLPHKTPQDVFDSVVPPGAGDPQHEQIRQVLQEADGSSREIRSERWYWPGKGAEVTAVYTDPSSDKGIWTIKKQVAPGEWNEQTFFEGSTADTAYTKHYDSKQGSTAWKIRESVQSLPTVSVHAPGVPLYERSVSASTESGTMADVFQKTHFATANPTFNRGAFLAEAKEIEASPAWQSFLAATGNGPVSIRFQETSTWDTKNDPYVDRNGGYLVVENRAGDRLVITAQPRDPGAAGPVGPAGDPPVTVYAKTRRAGEELSVITLAEKRTQLMPRMFVGDRGEVHTIPQSDKVETVLGNRADYSVANGAVFIHDVGDGHKEKGSQKLTLEPNRDDYAAPSLLSLFDKDGGGWNVVGTEIVSGNPWTTLNGPASAKPPPPKALVPGQKPAAQRYANLTAKDLSGPGDPRLLELYDEQRAVTAGFEREINAALEAQGIKTKIHFDTKKPGSIYGKLKGRFDKGEIYPLGKITDLSRARINVDTNDLAEVAKIDKVLRAKLKFDAKDSPNYVDEFRDGKDVGKKTEGYSRSHLILKDEHGNSFELQIGTQDISDFIDARVGKTTLHDALYKGKDLGISVPESLQKEYKGFLKEISARNNAGKPVGTDTDLSARIDDFKKRVGAALPEKWQGVPELPAPSRGNRLIAALESPTALRIGRALSALSMVVNLTNLGSHIIDGRPLDATRDLSGVLVDVYGIGTSTRALAGISRASATLKWMGVVGGFMQVGVGFYELATGKADKVSSVLDIAAGAGTIAGIWGAGAWWGPVGWGVAFVATVAHVSWNWNKDSEVSDLADGLEAPAVPAPVAVEYRTADEVIRGLSEINGASAAGWQGSRRDETRPGVTGATSVTSGPHAGAGVAH